MKIHKFKDIYKGVKLKIVNREFLLEKCGYKRPDPNRIGVGYLDRQYRKPPTKQNKMLIRASVESTIKRKDRQRAPSMIVKSKN